MLIIKTKQLQVMQNGIHHSFLSRMEESIIENFEVTRRTEEFKHDIRKTVTEAEHFGFYTEEAIEQYLYLKWKYPAFKKTPLNKDILEILTFPDRRQEVKIDELIFYFEKK
jgi:hypothetical protein